MNEKNISYGNGDILPMRSTINTHFKTSSEAYEQELHNNLTEQKQRQIDNLEKKTTVSVGTKRDQYNQ